MTDDILSKKFSETLDLGMSLAQPTFCLSGIVKGSEHKSLRQLFWRLAWRGGGGKKDDGNFCIPQITRNGSKNTCGVGPWEVGAFLQSQSVLTAAESRAEWRSFVLDTLDIFAWGLTICFFMLQAMQLGFT